jgi:hypothetical protein
VRRHQVADCLLRPRQIAAIGGQGVRRRAAFGREHGEEGVDRGGQGALAPRHGLGRDHPRLGGQAHAAQRGDDVEEVRGVILSQPVALHAQPRQQRHQRRIVGIGRLLDQPDQRDWRVQVQIQLGRRTSLAAFRSTRPSPASARPAGKRDLRESALSSLP